MKSGAQGWQWYSCCKFMQHNLAPRNVTLCTPRQLSGHPSNSIYPLINTLHILAANLRDKASVCQCGPSGTSSVQSLAGRLCSFGSRCRMRRYSHRFQSCEALLDDEFSVARTIHCDKPSLSLSSSFATSCLRLNELHSFHPAEGFHVVKRLDAAVYNLCHLFMVRS